MKKIISSIFLIGIFSICFAQDISMKEKHDSINKLIKQAPRNNLIVISKVNSYEADIYLKSARSFLSLIKGINRHQAKVSFIPSWSTNIRNLERILATEGEMENHDEATIYRNQLKSWFIKLLVDELSSILNKPIRWIDGVVVVEYPVEVDEIAWLSELSEAYGFKVYFEKN